MNDLKCPECGSTQVYCTAGTAYMANTGEHYCNTMKTNDEDSTSGCVDCEWEGVRGGLKDAREQQGGGE